MNLLYSTFLVLAPLTTFCAANKNTEESASSSTFQVEYQWTFLNFTWPSQEDYENAIATKQYIPENNAMAGIKFHNDRFYIAMPRIRPGVPVTLGYIPTGNNTPQTDPLIIPYPDWDTNKLDDDCSKLQSVQSMEIDKNGIMWVLDGVRIKSDSKCPPKLVLFDLSDGKVVHTFTFPEHVCLSKGGFLNDIVVDDSDGGFAYITDHSRIDPGLIVYSREKDSAWKLRDASMFAEVNASRFEVDGQKFDQLAPIDGIALSPPGKSRCLYYCALAGLNLYAISTEILKNEKSYEGSDWRRAVTLIGEKQAQSDGLVVDNNGDLYYGLLPLYGVGRWNENKPFSTAEIVDTNKNTMIWTDSFAFDDKGCLYLLCNNIHKFFNPGYKLEKTDEVKFRIMKLFTSTKSYLY